MFSFKQIITDGENDNIKTQEMVGQLKLIVPKAIFHPKKVIQHLFWIRIEFSTMSINRLIQTSTAPDLINWMQQSTKSGEIKKITPTA